MIEGVLSKVEHSILTGHPTQRLPGYASFCLRFIEGEAILMLFDSNRYRSGQRLRLHISCAQSVARIAGDGDVP